MLKESIRLFRTEKKAYMALELEKNNGTSVVTQFETSVQGRNRGLPLAVTASCSLSLRRHRRASLGENHAAQLGRPRFLAFGCRA
ncbi:hypothetical protein Mapa_008402 [Marchantia paleacea]|nr:hypothetical protein Mapa_008402 [Marchantia paleacea]